MPGNAGPGLICPDWRPWKTRAIWRRLDCLNPSVQKMEFRIHWKRHAKPVAALPWAKKGLGVTSGAQRRCL